MSPRITYLLGAGASYHAFPILSRLNEEMKTFGYYLYSELHRIDAKSQKDIRNNPLDDPNPFNIKSEFGLFLAWDIHYFGRKGEEFGTIDTYAKKLSLNESYQNEEELSRLKLAVSIFFTLWQLSEYKNERCVEPSKPYIGLDKRYVSLLATYLEKDGNKKIILPENVNFVTWNYDLQLEFAYRQFCNNPGE